MNIFRDLPQALRGDILDKLDASLLSGRIARRHFLQWSAALGVSFAAARAAADELDTARANQDARAKALTDEYDYIICGGGTCGCNARGAARRGRSQSAANRGGRLGHRTLGARPPKQWFMNLGTERDWNDVAVPSPSVNGRAIPSHMGHVLGGGQLDSTPLSGCAATATTTTVGRRPLVIRPGATITPSPFSSA